MSEEVALNVEETKHSHQLFLILNYISLLKPKLFSGYLHEGNEVINK